MDMFKNMTKNGKIVIIVTHSKNTSKYPDIVYIMKKGFIEKSLLNIENFFNFLIFNSLISFIFY